MMMMMRIWMAVGVMMRDQVASVGVKGMRMIVMPKRIFWIWTTMWRKGWMLLSWLVWIGMLLAGTFDDAREP